VTQQQVERQFRIGRIVLGSTRPERWRYFAGVDGLMGSRMKKSYFGNAETIGPLGSSSATAIGPPKR
jgi:hypothetical protein